MKIWRTHISLDELQKICANTLVSHLKIVFTEIGDDYIKAEMAMGPHLMQPLGTLHGGASCVLAETVGSVGSYFCIDPKTHYTMGLDINTNHIRAVKTGVLTATGRPYHVGKLTQIWSIEIVNDQNQLISVSRLTVIALEK